MPPAMPGPPMPPHMGGGYNLPPMPHPVPPQPVPPSQSKSSGDTDEPPSKKAKTEDSLMPEEEFLKRNKVSCLFALTF